ncbi:MAG: hypothetical protein GY757_41550, partial [bacterium]|nr:hypothetical protein [bacterium]
MPPEIGFNYLGQFDQDINKTTFTFSHLSAGDDMSPESERGHALDISGAIIEGKLALHFNYSRKQYYEKTI